MSHSMKRRVTVLATTISVLLIAGVVFAAWTVDADGAGSATADSIVGGDIDFTAPLTGLYPGHTENVDVEITNNESFPVSVSAIADTTATANANDACDESTVSLTLDDTLSTLAIEPGGSETYSVAVTMTDAADNACVGDTFNFDLAATLASVAD